MKRALVAPLDWGLGHATRCIPIIRSLQQRGVEVVIAGSGDAHTLLRTEFPSLLSKQLPGYTPKYPGRKGSMVWTMLRQIPHFMRVIREEHRMTEQFVKELSIDVVISDNRYGCWSSSAKSVFITHQSNIMMPQRFGWLSPWVRRKNMALMGKFSECWLPDFPGGDSLAGSLATFGEIASSLRVSHIGPLSRFKAASPHPADLDIIAVFSGPEPQRSIFEETVFNQLKKLDVKYLVVRGQFGGSPDTDDPQVKNFMTTSDLQQALSRASVVIARSGYSTIMDLAALGKKAILVPTPGQTEQMYLATRLAEKNIVVTADQHHFDLSKALQRVESTSGFNLSFRNDLLETAIDRVFAT